ncbi:MAG TPA: M48 family metalloprotease [Gammaproteobacteria bacterium]|nr:M48 family metalloprotease [Gammaproteobacteria bacterium]
MTIKLQHKALVTATALTSLLLLSSCANINLRNIGSAFKTAQQAFSDTTLEEEKEIGRTSAAVLLGAVKLFPDKRTQVYVNRVGRWVALQSTRPDLPWRFAVLDDTDINAFAAPGGYVFITKGLLASLRSEAELAGVLAHEIAHVTQKHHLEAIQHQARLKLGGMVVGAALAERGHDTKTLAAIAGGARFIYSRGLNKEDEFEADRIGVVLAARAGYDPYGLPAVLQTLDRINADSGRLALLFKTHPKPSERLAQLSTAMQNHFADGAQFVAGEQRFRQQLAHLAQ